MYANASLTNSKQLLNNEAADIPPLHLENCEIILQPLCQKAPGQLSAEGAF